MKPKLFLLIGCLFLLGAMAFWWNGRSATTAEALQPTGPNTPYPIMFVTQPPIAEDFTSITSTFGNHQASLSAVGRGGALWIRYPDGTLKNLTTAAGYGTTGANGFQDHNAIAVRDPAISWDGNKAVFSMVIGAADQQYQVDTYYWQLYEITGFGQGQNPVITKVPHQPVNYNNISPIYGTNGRIIFTTDRPRNGAPHLYPQRDEYELAPTVSGLWSLDPMTGDLRLLNHAPSGDFSPFIDSYGRVIFTQWDHLQRDQQADGDAGYGTGQNCDGGSWYGTFNYSDESADAVVLNDRTEVFPEPRTCRQDLLAGTHLTGNSFNHFMPWMTNEDGTESEIVNHLGRHDFHPYFDASFDNDPNLYYHYIVPEDSNQNPVQNVFQIAEDPLHPGDYYAVEAPEFGTHAAGQIIKISMPPTLSPDDTAVIYYTHPDTAGTTTTPDNSGHYREPLPLSDGTMIAVHTSEPGEATGYNLDSNYDFSLKTLTLSGNGYWVAGQPLTPNMVETISYWSPDEMLTYTGPLWQLNPVEVRPRPIPNAPNPTLGAPEMQIFNQAQVDPAALRVFMVQNNLALLVSHDVTTRDDKDHQQPFNLRIFGGTAQTIGAPGTIYDLAYIQFFQADQLRGWTGCCSSTPMDGRRVLAQPMHDNLAMAANLPITTGPAGSAVLGTDGSMAAFVPAQRAMTWQLTDQNGVGIVRERYWLTFQPGEIRVCTSCHGLSKLDQAGHTPPMNPPQALLTLLQYWKLSANPVERIYLPAVEQH